MGTPEDAAAELYFTPPEGDEEGLLAEEEIENILKLEIWDEKRCIGEHHLNPTEARDRAKLITKAQQALDEVKKEEAVKALKAEILSIMKSAPDLRTLEKNIADWLGEQRSEAKEE